MPKAADVASEADTATLMRATKTVVSGRYSAIDGRNALFGPKLGGGMVPGSWTGCRPIERMPDRRFAVLIEPLLILAVVSPIVRASVPGRRAAGSG